MNVTRVFVWKFGCQWGTPYNLFLCNLFNLSLQTAVDIVDAF